MFKKLYEFSFLISVPVVIAADSEEKAREKAESLTADELLDSTWIEDEACNIADSQHLVEERDPSDQDIETLECEAHFIA